MGGERAQPPDGLRPAQLGIVLIGRVILGHISATLVDLDQRGLLEISEIPGGGDQDWLLTRRRDGAEAPLPFEATLLDGLFAGQPAVRLSEIAQELVPTLNRVRAQLHRDAVRHGRLRRWHRGEPRPRTKRGERLLTQIHSFRQELRGLAASGDALAMGRLAPYLIMFGLGGSSRVRVASRQGTGPASGPAIEDTWSCSDRFAMGWITVFNAVPPVHGQGSGTGQPGNFVQEWSAPHGHGGHSHGASPGGYGGGYAGGHDGGHDGGGGFAGGHGH
jgi:Predicted membrane protein (DUF2207)